MGIDIGAASTKVVQLRYEKERAILETYGELSNAHYLKDGEGGGVGLLRYLDQDIANLLKDALKESNVTSTAAVFSVPATASFITQFSLPRLSLKELEQAVPFEARKYVPIPMAEVVLDWDLLETTEDQENRILLVAVPREVIEKFKRVAELAGLTISGLEVETFSLVRSLAGRDIAPTALINMGHLSTSLAFIDQGKLRSAHNFSHGSLELTRALERGLGINQERAESLKREIGLSDRMEDRETATILSPLIEILFEEIARSISLYNRHASRHIQRMILSGSGSNLRGMVDQASIKFGMEVSKGNPFSRVAAPAFLQPILREIGPGFAVAVGLALHAIATD